ncbi:FKBP-type peptidyl-prolyl cis-trans isomerase [Cryobacterium sp. PH31-O1]|uniref:FKBP-type peptidyl-prolyl cis-trans isomerase n=1 Tax=Cryobacterium sp. PH31-O1 TaxID=3046306 RepID=UPI0024BB7A11|nr:FKBP-type peptidyl-prolyl cis-trans isomerase [Cryobacterium sp. PH31-O1]MDJ0337348.1 FKBP-type peptidyl-prolyl cis-trans isomerase [Cryobacterium sp. PH31-O1]
MSKIPALLTIVGLTLALTACGTSNTPQATDAAAASSPSGDCTQPGKRSDSVKVTGDFGAPLDISIDAPLEPTTTERTVAIEGKGKDTAKKDSIVEVAITLYNAKTKKVVQPTTYSTDGASLVIPVNDTSFLPGLVRSANCAVEGDRVVTVSPASDAFADKGATGVAAGEPVVFVMDIVKVIADVPTQASGADQPVEEGFPAVALADDGAPTITMPATDAPTDLKISTLKKGDGEVVTDGASVAVAYTGALWATGATFDSSWGSVPYAVFPTGGVIAGFTQALVGQTVGSQVIAVIPPEFGYGPEGTEGISGTDTLVFVIDIVAVAGGPTA